MLKTAAQHELAVTTSLQRLPLPYNSQNTVTTSSNRIYYVIRDTFQHKIGVFPYSIEVLLDSISIYIIYCMSVLWNINRYQPDSFKSTANRHFGRSIRWRSQWVLPQWYGANGQITMTVHNYRSRQVHETLNGVNPSSRFRDLHSAKSGPNLCQIWQVFVPWACSYGANGQMTTTVHN